MTGAIPMWRLQRGADRSIACTLHRLEARGCVLTVILDGDEIAVQRYSTRLDAISQASFLLQRLTEGGWTIVSGFPSAVLH